MQYQEVQQLKINVQTATSGQDVQLNMEVQEQTKPDCITLKKTIPFSNNLNGICKLHEEQFLQTLSSNNNKSPVHQQQHCQLDIESNNSTQMKQNKREDEQYSKITNFQNQKQFPTVLSLIKKVYDFTRQIAKIRVIFSLILSLALYFGKVVSIKYSLLLFLLNQVFCFLINSLSKVPDISEAVIINRPQIESQNQNATQEFQSEIKRLQTEFLKNLRESQNINDQLFLENLTNVMAILRQKVICNEQELKQYKQEAVLRNTTIEVIIMQEAMNQITMQQESQNLSYISQTSEQQQGGLNFQEINTLNSSEILQEEDIQKFTHGQDSCIICFSQFQSGNNIRKFYCSHIFHKSCVDLWLFKHNSCPSCRQTVFLSTDVSSISQ